MPTMLAAVRYMAIPLKIPKARRKTKRAGPGARPIRWPWSPPMAAAPATTTGTLADPKTGDSIAATTAAREAIAAIERSRQPKRMGRVAPTIRISKGALSCSSPLIARQRRIPGAAVDTATRIRISTTTAPLRRKRRKAFSIVIFPLDHCLDEFFFGWRCRLHICDTGAYTSVLHHDDLV